MSHHAELLRTIIVWLEDIEEDERTQAEKNILELCRRHLRVPEPPTNWTERGPK